MDTSFSFESDLDVNLDLTPLIDTIFLLLIFFIMATTFAPPVLDVALARADSAGKREIAAERLIVTITGEGRILFDDTQVAEEDLDAAMAPLPPETPVVFNVDQGAPFGLFVKVLDTAKKQRRTDVVINASQGKGTVHDSHVPH